VAVWQQPRKKPTWKPFRAKGVQEAELTDRQEDVTDTTIEQLKVTYRITL
jgi:hypothetical protein